MPGGSRGKRWWLRWAMLAAALASTVALWVWSEGVQTGQGFAWQQQQEKNGARRAARGAQDGITRILSWKGLAPIANAASELGLQGFLYTVICVLATWVYRRRILRTLESVGLQRIASLLSEIVPASKEEELQDSVHDDTTGLPDLVDVQEEELLDQGPQEGMQADRNGSPGEGPAQPPVSARGRTRRVNLSVLSLPEACLIPCELAPPFAPPRGWLVFDKQLGVVPYETRDAWQQENENRKSATQQNASPRQLPPVRNLAQQKAAPSSSSVAADVPTAKPGKSKRKNKRQQRGK